MYNNANCAALISTRLCLDLINIREVKAILHMKQNKIDRIEIQAAVLPLPHNPLVAGVLKKDLYWLGQGIKDISP